jgi:site-specific DNA recombinase
MRVALYVRRSTEDHQQASIATQIESATAFCAKRGWQIVETFADDGISGSEFELRPGLTRLIGGTGFAAVVVRDLDRLGRDMLRVPLLIEKLASKGVAVWCYSTGTRAEIDDPTQKFLVTAVAFARELEVRATRARVTEKLRRGAEKGHCVGGDVYGYLRERAPEGVLYRIHPDEAPVVRELFARRAAGESFGALAHDLNARGVPSPRAGRRGTGSWDCGCVWEILGSDRYRGVLVWGRRGSKYEQGTRKEIERPEAERVVAVRPELALVDEDVWKAVRARDVARGARRSGTRATHLLSTIARCVCGGSMQVTRMRWGSGAGAVNLPAYACGWAHRRGKAVCENTLRRPVDEVDLCVVNWIERELLSEEVVGVTLAGVRAAIEASASAPEVDTVREQREAALGRVAAEVSRLTRAIATTDDAPSALIDALRDAEARQRGLRQELAKVSTPTPVGFDWSVIEATVRARLGQLRALFLRQAAAGRAVLSALLRGPIVCRPVEIEGARGRRYHLTAEATLPGLVILAGINGAAAMSPFTPAASPEGFANTPRFAMTRLRRAI